MEIVPSQSLPPVVNQHKKDEVLDSVGEIGVELSEEIKRRLNDKKYFNRLTTTELLDSLLRIASILNKQPAISLIQNNVSVSQKRVKELAEHPARRKELRANIRRINGISR